MSVVLPLRPKLTAAQRRVCVECGENPKRKSHPKWCEECWLPRQPIDVQVRAAQRRLAMTPEEARRPRVSEREWPEGRRWCTGCQTFVRLTYVTGSRCKACASRAAHASRIESTYTIHGRPFTEADYQALLRMQHGRCYLCRRQSLSRRLAIDHNHETGEVRGLLCPDPEWGCNLKVVARFDADPDPLAMAMRLVEYLKNPPARRLDN